MTRIEDEARFYDEVGRLTRAIGGARQLAGSSAREGWPTRGLYLFFEEGEIRRDTSPRITRIGTHALRQQSKTTLWGRLAHHRGQVDGRSPGGGNHRGSIFRLHLGAALVDRDALASGLQQSWLSTKCDPVWAQEEDDLERAVIRVGTGVRPHQQVNQITRRHATSALILRQVSGKPAPAGFDGHGGCFIETGAGRAAYGSGNFYSDPAPTVGLHSSARRWHWGKVTFEQRVMRRWLCATTSP